jgi:hypothetical protein
VDPAGPRPWSRTAPWPAGRSGPVGAGHRPTVAGGGPPWREALAIPATPMPPTSRSTGCGRVAPAGTGSGPAATQPGRADQDLSRPGPPWAAWTWPWGPASTSRGRLHRRPAPGRGRPRAGPAPRRRPLRDPAGTATTSPVTRRRRGRVVACPERVDPAGPSPAAPSGLAAGGLDRPGARWKVLAQQLVMAELDLPPVRAGPGWSDAGTARGRPRPRPPVAGGAAADQPGHAQRRRPRLVRPRPAAPRARPDAPGVATGLVGASIGSGAGGDQPFPGHLGDPPRPLLRQPPARLPPLHRDLGALARRPAGHAHRGATRRTGPHPGQLRGGIGSTGCGTGLEWRALTTTYGGAWVRP